MGFEQLGPDVLSINIPCNTLLSAHSSSLSLIIVQFQKKSIPTPRKVIRNSLGERGRGVLKVKILEAKYEAKLEFPGGRGGGAILTYKAAVEALISNLFLSRE